MAKDYGENALGMHDIIGTLSKIILKNVCRYALPIRRITHMCSGCDSDDNESVLI